MGQTAAADRSRILKNARYAFVGFCR